MTTGQGFYTIREDVLCINGEPVEYRGSPNHGSQIIPRLVVIHYTGDNSLEGALSWLCSPKSGVSAHLVIGKDGTVYQLLPFNIQGWHAGRSAYDGENQVNGFSVGIENVGLGDDWPPDQIETNRAVVAALKNYYPIEDVVGHEDVAPGRKVDPGPNFPWDQVMG
jgi:N-acetylmuramoyl-L-alanine amidase